MPAKPQPRQPWTCPHCSQRFTSKNQWHSCGVFELDPLFAQSEPHVRRLYERFVETVREFGEVTVIPQKSRIAIQARIRFAALTPKKTVLSGHLVLERRIESPRFERIDTYSPRNHVHIFRLRSEREFDKALRQLIGAAYAAGS